MKLSIIGAPGSGKGTQAKLLVKKFHLKHVSSDLLRAEVKKKTSMGLKLKYYMDRGLLVPVKLTFPIFKKYLVHDNVLLDGGPRTLQQVKNLKNIFVPDYVINLTVPRNVIFDRLLKRAKIEGRSDDNRKVITRRIQVYHKQTEPVLKYYKDRLITVNGNQAPKKTLQEILKKIKQ